LLSPVVLEKIGCCVQNTVPVIVTLHLVVKNLALSCGAGGNQVLVQNILPVIVTLHLVVEDLALSCGAGGNQVLYL
jgi:hypothetical protein